MNEDELMEQDDQDFEDWAASEFERLEQDNEASD